jgi:energy-coupling factor transport system substrate-specific component
MILPKKMPTKVAMIVYMIVCGLYGLLFGILYAPAQALLFGLDYKGMIAWIVAGFPFDVIHGISNFIVGMLVLPMVKILRKLEHSNNQ